MVIGQAYIFRYYYPEQYVSGCKNGSFSELIMKENLQNPGQITENVNISPLHKTGVSELNTKT